MENLTLDDSKPEHLDLSKNTKINLFEFVSESIVSMDITGIRGQSKPYFDFCNSYGDYGGCNKLKELKVNNLLRDYKDIKNIKTRRGDEITISTYNSKGEKVCSNYDPKTSKCITK